MNETFNRIAIVGAGAIGCRIAAHLAQHGVESTLFDGWHAHVDAIRDHGLRLEHAGQTSAHRLPVYHFEAPPPNETYDLILLAVRGDATRAVLPLVSGLLAKDGCVVACQNGISEEDIAEVVGAERTLGCSMIFGARVTEPGCVEVLHGEDTLCLGEMQGPAGERAESIRRILALCGTATTTDDLLAYRWKKLVYNCMGNPLTLLSDQVARDLHADRTAREVMIGIAREVLACAIAAGVRPEPVLELAAERWLAGDAYDSADIHTALQAHGNFLDQRRFSMWADFQQRGRTEVEALSGYVVRKASALGLAAPMNAAVSRLVHELEAGKRTAGTQAIQELHRVLSR